jgi:hypothetical protein
MALEVFQGASIPRELSSAAMEYLWAKWKTLNGTNDLTLQRLTEESSHPLRDNLVMLMPVGDDFVQVYVGRTIQTELGFNPTGRLLSQSGPLSRDLLDLYRQAAQNVAPSFVRMTGPRAQGDIWQGLALPIKLAEGVVMVICYIEQVSPQGEIYEYLFQTSADAMVVASPIISDIGETLDGWVVMINAAARRLLNFDGSIGNLRLQHIKPLAQVDFSFKLYPPVAPGTRVRIAPGPGFHVEVIRFVRVFALVIRPVVAPALVPDDLPAHVPA